MFLTPTKLRKGFTIIELYIVAAITIILFSGIIFIINPSDHLKKARDEKRLADLSNLDRAINEYRMNNGDYPDTVSVLRDSTTLPGGSTALYDVNTGWIKASLTGFLTKLPLDPLNDATYKYWYFHDVSGYELNAVMESQTTQMTSDGGNDPNRYEIGNNLLLILP